MEHHDLRLVFAGPVFLLYAELGLLFAKQLVLAWRSPIPPAQASAHIAAREETRKYYLAVCDFFRATLGASLLFWPIRLTVSPADRTVLVVSWLATWLLISVVATVWVEMKRKQLLALSLRACPEELPDFLEQSEIARWPVCYQPSAPMVILKGAHGYSLNLANKLTHLGAAYVAGLVALLALLPRDH